jgi:hypothetical protein
MTFLRSDFAESFAAFASADHSVVSVVASGLLSRSKYPSDSVICHAIGQLRCSSKSSISQ